MITLISSLIGFFGAAFPELLSLLKDKADRAHELHILDRQITMQKAQIAVKMEAIDSYYSHKEQSVIYKTYHSGIAWVDALNATVRPVLAYAFFILYASTKIAQYYMLLPTGALEALMLIWMPEDHAIFAGIISFYFGQRAMRKIRSNI